MAREQSDFELELYRRVDEILYYVWDPIGLAASPAARNEYKLATENMGLSADPRPSHCSLFVVQAGGSSVDQGVAFVNPKRCVLKHHVLRYRDAVAYILYIHAL
jgi:hypothetical protein